MKPPIITSNLPTHVQSADPSFDAKLKAIGLILAPKKAPRKLRNPDDPTPLDEILLLLGAIQDDVKILLHEAQAGSIPNNSARNMAAVGRRIDRSCGEAISALMKERRLATYRQANDRRRGKFDGPLLNGPN